MTLVRLRVPEVGCQPVAVLVPRAVGAVREELARGHLRRAGKLFDTADGDVAKRDLLRFLIQVVRPRVWVRRRMRPSLDTRAGTHHSRVVPPPHRVWLGSGRAPNTGVMNGPGPLGAFLQARRARLRPEDVGLRDLGPRRRVAGLRREELAQLAGVSVSYYARLEQGQSRGASAEVLDAIARALLLDDHEREHLDRLAGAARHAPRLRRPRPEKLADETRDLLRAVDGVPAIVLGRRTDVLAWNTLGHALLAGHLDFLGPDAPARRLNMSRMLFLDPHCQELYADWKRKARAVVGNLRIAVGLSTCLLADCALAAIETQADALAGVGPEVAEELTAVSAAASMARRLLSLPVEPEPTPAGAGPVPGPRLAPPPSAGRAARRAGAVRVCRCAPGPEGKHQPRHRALRSVPRDGVGYLLGVDLGEAGARLGRQPPRRPRTARW